MKRLALAVLLAASSASASAPPPVLDRVVAVVDKSPILLSEIRIRARPFAKQMAGTGEKMTEEKMREIHRQLVERIIDERIIEQEADKARITVSADEVEKGIESVAQASKITSEEIFAEVERLGMTRQHYRDEVRRQIIEGKWLVLRVQSRIRDLPSDPKASAERLEAERKKELARLRKDHYIEVRP